MSDIRSRQLERRRSDRRARRKLRAVGLMAGVAMALVGGAGLIFAFVLAYGSAFWDRLALSIGMPGTLIIGLGGLCLLVPGLWIVISDLRRSNGGPLKGRGGDPLA